ncbi:cbb3-type cytochrome oxidase assembly protein CcoS [uncultured Campylobacter sp.]|uniref:cbb3-type cytochrome oxidase assembly protein CcoS n=1 Tax=uncultured Campylobacter sp. TaxID=218934 RepID=UPI00262CC2B6|nr:cbb3-type cytochrome oxidase assembly protein CcoS [uncultured Campylobacter sp.]
MTNVLMMMIGVSIFIFFIALLSLLWGIKNKQFDDDYKFTSLNDSEESLQNAIKMEERRKRLLKDKEKK